MISDRDFDLLSAYVDDQLPTAEKAGLEARLTVEPELRTTLRELRLTVRALRALPPVAPPRSFALTPEQVAGPAKSAGLGAKGAGLGAKNDAGLGRGTRRPMSPALRVAAAFSALALAVTVIVDVRGGGFLAASPEEAVVSVAAAPTTLPAEAPLAAPSETASDNVQILEMATIDATATTDPTVAGDAAPADVTPATAAGLMPAPTETPSAERSAATPAPESTESTKSVDAADASETPVSVAEVPPAATAPATDLYYADGEAASGTANTAPNPGLPPVRVLELGLAMLTVLLGLGAWFARRGP